MLPGLEMMACPEMAVSMDVMQHVINVESSRNPYAIGVVGGALVRQPKALDEALATVRMLEEKGYNPINQLVGYILSEDPTYITTYKNARAIIRRIDRDDLLQALVRDFVKH